MVDLLGLSALQFPCLRPTFSVGLLGFLALNCLEILRRVDLMVSGFLGSSFILPSLRPTSWVGLLRFFKLLLV